MQRRVCVRVRARAVGISHTAAVWCSGKARAFICLLAGPGINNAAIRYKNEKKGWKEVVWGKGYGKDPERGPIEGAGAGEPPRDAARGSGRGRGLAEREDEGGQTSVPRIARVNCHTLSLF